MKQPHKTPDLIAKQLACNAYHQRVIRSKKAYQRRAKHRGEWGL